MNELKNEDLTLRSIKAITIVLNGGVEMKKGGAKVDSSSGTKKYTVTNEFCDCPDFQGRPVICKHIRAYRIVRLLEEADEQSKG